MEWAPVTVEWPGEAPAAEGYWVDVADPARVRPYQVETSRAPDGSVVRRLHFVEVQLAAGATREYRLGGSAEGAKAESDEAFEGWRSQSAQAASGLQRGGRVWLQRISGYRPGEHELSFKVYDHIYGHDADRPLTKGLGGQFPHHRGLFLGWNQAKRCELTHDFWHGRTGEVLEEAEEKREVFGLGKVCGSMRTHSRWHLGSEETWIEETRTVTLWATAPGRRLFDVEVRLVNPGSKHVALRGDPHHAGLHLRLASEVEAVAKEVVWAWPEKSIDQGNDIRAGASAAIGSIPWRGGSLVVGMQDQGPATADLRLCARGYGRFGVFREFEIPPGGEAALRVRFSLEERKAGFTLTSFEDAVHQVLPQRVVARVIP